MLCCRGLYCFGRNQYGKSASLTGSAFYHNFAAYHFYNSFRERKTKAVSGCRVRRITLVEFLKNLCLRRFVHSYAGIFDTYLNQAVCFVTPDVQRTILVGEFDGIGY